MSALQKSYKVEIRNNKLIKYVSPSALGLWQRCEVAWQFRYSRKINIPPQAIVHRGKAVHSAIEINFKNKLISNQDEPEDILCDITRDEFVKRVQDGIYILKDDRFRKNNLLNDELNLGIEHTKIFRREIAEKIIPMWIEHELWADIGLELPLKGYIDLFDAFKTIHEFKSKSPGRTTSKGWEKNQLQPGFYSILVKENANYYPEFKYHLINQKGDDIRETKQNDNNLRILKLRIDTYIKSVKTGIFKPAEPGHWQCNEKWCGYWPICEYAQ